MRKMFIQTMYIPSENIDFLEEWLSYHQKIGVEHFYLYDNSGSVAHAQGSNVWSVAVHGKDRYGNKINNVDVTDLENEIFKKYPVTKIKWQPKNKNGLIYGDQVNAMNHYSSIVKTGLTAFIDIDEFIVKREEFRESRLFQRKYESRFHYSENSVMNITNGFEIDSRSWSSKCIIEMKNYQSPQSVHFSDLNIPESDSFFNHYNHNEFAHKWLLKNYKDFDPSWKPVPYKNIFVRMPSLKELAESVEL